MGCSWTHAQCQHRAGQCRDETCTGVTCLLSWSIRVDFSKGRSVQVHLPVGGRRRRKAIRALINHLWLTDYMALIRREKQWKMLPRSSCLCSLVPSKVLVGMGNSAGHSHGAGVGGPSCAGLHGTHWTSAPQLAPPPNPLYQTNPLAPRHPGRYWPSHAADKSSDSISLPRCSCGDTAGHRGSKSDLDILVKLGLCQKRPRMSCSQSGNLPREMNNCFPNF